MVMIKNRKHKRGDSKNFVFKVYTDSTKESAKDISEYTFKFTLKENKTDSQADAKIARSVTVGAGAGSSGTATLAVSASDFDLTPKLYYYDIEKTTGGGSVVTEMEGTLEITQDIST